MHGHQKQVSHEQSADRKIKIDDRWVHLNREDAIDHGLLCSAHETDRINDECEGAERRYERVSKGDGLDGDDQWGHGRRDGH